MPSILLASLSGLKLSILSSFSPVVINFIGLSTTDLILKAAPPRASPSSFVKTTPVSSSVSLKDLATLTASWPVIESRTSNISLTSTADLISLNSFIKSSSMWSLPAVSIMITSWLFCFAYSTASFAVFAGSWVPFSNTGTLTFSPTTWSCLIAAGR